MSEAPYPTVVAAPGVVADDGHEHFWSPRNIIAFAMVALFAAIELLPYWIKIPVGRNGDMILQGSKTVETIIMLVLAFFFATTVNSARKDAALQNAAATGQAMSQAPIKVDPPARITIEETPHAPDPDRVTSPTSADAGGSGVSAWADGPPE